MSSLSASIRNSSLWVMARTAIAALLGVFVTAYIVRTLSVEDYGTYNVLYSLMGYVGILGAFGIPAVFQRFLPEAWQAQDYGLIRKLVVRGLLLRVVLSAVIIALIFLFSAPLGRILRIDNWVGYFGVFSLGILIYLEVGLLTTVLHSLFLHQYAVIANITYLLFRAGLVWGLLAGGLGLPGLLWTEVVAWFFWMLLLLYYYRAEFSRKHPESSPTVFPTRRFFRYGGYSFFNEMGSSVLGVSTDFFVISAFLGPAAVGLYAFADRVLKMFLNCMPHVVLIDVIRPTFFMRYAESKNPRQLSEMFNFLTKLSAFFVFPVAVTLIVIGDKLIVHVFGAKYLDAYPVLVLIAIFAAINVVAQPTGLVLQAIEKNEINLYSKIFAVYNLVVEILIINRYGIIGVAFVTCTAVLFKNYYCYYYARKYTGISFDYKKYVAALVNSMVLALFYFLCRNVIFNIYDLVVVFLAASCVYLITCYFNKIFSDLERSQVNKVMPGKIFVF